MTVITELDAKAIDSLFHEHYPALCRYAHSILKDQDLAEDIVQQLFIVIWEKRGELDVLENPRAYLYRSVYNRCLNEVKRSKRRGEYADVGAMYNLQSDGSAGERIMSSELEAQIEFAVQQLPDKCQEVFRLSRFEELSYKEIAAELNVSVKTVENHMGKALRIMREELKEYLPLVVITILLMKGW